MRHNQSSSAKERSTENPAPQDLDLVERVALLVDEKDRAGLNDMFEDRREVLLREGMSQMGAVAAADAYMRGAAEQAHIRYAGDSNKASEYLEMTHEVVNSNPLY